MHQSKTFPPYRNPAFFLLQAAPLLPGLLRQMISADKGPHGREEGGDGTVNALGRFVIRQKVAMHWGRSVEGHSAQLLQQEEG
jgi:hypothetical protein